jgi:hypothetical protein
MLLGWIGDIRTWLWVEKKETAQSDDFRWAL